MNKMTSGAAGRCEHCGRCVACSAAMICLYCRLPAKIPAQDREYETARDKLVSDAAEAVEIYGEDELERFAREQ